ncbi:MAG: hypothetical protein JKY98_00320 [Gammaproteobacteria bacterium]|nr:hypothetical protein [Gammaproteobacteria bacterium]
MKRSIILALTIGTAFSGLAVAQSNDDYKAPQTDYGQPDLQGVWNFASNTPMQRPKRYGAQEFLTSEQIEEAVARQEARAAAADAAAAILIIDPDAPEATSDPGIYNDFWFEIAGIGDTVRTSIIVFPTDGRVPPAVEGAVVQSGGLGPDVPGTRPVRYVFGGIAKNGPEDRGVSERCLVGFNAGPPLEPHAYNNNVQIVQNRDNVAILSEMIHDMRIIPITEKPELNDDIRMWSGDSRGYWDGDTLVVQTKNFNGLRPSFGSIGTNFHMVLTERFTRSAYDTITYEFTIDDPASFTDQISGVLPLTKVGGQIYEYACHEGNYAMPALLRGARLEELESASGEQ